MKNFAFVVDKIVNINYNFDIIENCWPDYN